MTTSPSRWRKAAPGARGRRLGVLTTAAVGVVAMLVGPGGVAQAATSDLSTTVDATYQTNGRVNAILAIGDTIYIGGRFTSVRPPGSGTTSVTRNHLAAFSKSTGALLPWNPNADKEVLALSASLDGLDVFVGGAFAKIGTTKRLRLAEVDATTGALQPWAPTSDNQVNTIAVTPTQLYVGGDFDVMDGQPRADLAALDYTGAVSSTWAPAADNRVRVLAPAPDGLSVFAGGDFLSINGDPSQKILSRLDATTGAPLPWKFHPGYPIHQFAFFNGMLFAAGDGSGGHIGAFDLGTGARVWTQQTDGGVQNMVIMDGVVYGGGHFDNVCVGVTDGATSGFRCPTNLATRHKLVAIDGITGALDPWNPGANSPLGVFGMASDDGSLEVGGDFTKIGTPNSIGGPTTSQQGYAQFSPAP
jgi:outer membrane protein assembly factor BamB